MAESLGSAKLVLMTDSAKLNQGIDTAKVKATQLDTKFKATAASIGRSMAGAGRMLIANFSVPLIGLGTGILKLAANFEKSMNKVRALTGATGDSFAQLEDQAKELGRTTQFSASQAADAMGFLAQAGFDANQIIATMPDTLNLAASAQLDLATTADIVSNIMTGYGLAVDDAGRATDVLTAAFTSANTDLTQLGEAMKFAGPIVSGFGIQFEEAAAALGLMGNAGVQASIAGTSLRGIMIRLADPTKEVKELMDELGINVKNADGSLVSLVEIIEQLEKSGADTSEQVRIFGQRAVLGMTALLGQGSEALREFTTELENSGGTAQRIADIQMEGLSGALLRLKSAFEALAISIGDTGLLDWVTKMVTGITALVSWSTEIQIAFASWGIQIEKIRASMQEFLGVMTDPRRLKAAEDNLIALVTQLNEIDSVGKVVAKTFKKFGDNVKDAGDNIKDVTDIVEDWDKAINESAKRVEAGRQLVIGWGTAIGLAEDDIWAMIGAHESWEAVVEATKPTLEEFMRLIIAQFGEGSVQAGLFADAVEEAMATVEETTKAAAAAAAEALKEEFREAALVVSGALGGFADLAQVLGGDWWNFFKALAIAEASINTWVAATRALATLGPILGPIAAAGMIAAGFARVAQIQAMQPPEFHTGGLVGRNQLAPFPGAQTGEGLAILREGERVSTPEQMPSRQITINIPRGTFVWSDNQMRAFIDRLAEVIGDDSTRLRGLVI
ncbi:hypothetical protein LCGC14_0746860 [marine sediment metagenome]|uniref:Phage tail tape measure protein domain-containing protein n=1 Tax=marine sediment metagenome TaxID=412755 RepID=A0A0F9Q535_9ZZZZ